MNLLALLQTYFAMIRRLLGGVSLCGHVGLIIGAIIGGLTGLLASIHPGLTLSASELVMVSTFFGVFAWLTIILILCAWLRYTFSSIAFMTMTIVVVSAPLIVNAITSAHTPALGWLIGMGIGLVIGEIYCWFCRKILG